MNSTNLNMLINGVMSLAGFFCLLLQAYWQRRVGSPDMQSKSARAFVIMTALVIGQVGLAYLQILPFGGTDRGTLTYFLWLLTLFWWTYSTVAYNLPILRQLDRLRERQSPYEWCSDGWCRFKADATGLTPFLDPHGAGQLARGSVEAGLAALALLTLLAGWMIH